MRAITSFGILRALTLYASLALASEMPSGEPESNENDLIVVTMTATHDGDDDTREARKIIVAIFPNVESLITDLAGKITIQIVNGGGINNLTVNSLDGLEIGQAVMTKVNDIHLKTDGNLSDALNETFEIVYGELIESPIVKAATKVDGEASLDLLRAAWLNMTAIASIGLIENIKNTGWSP